jgi:phage shock protein PspC (stress-responsive transcriptional regulator)
MSERPPEAATPGGPAAPPGSQAVAPEDQAPPAGEAPPDTTATTPTPGSTAAAGPAATPGPAATAGRRLGRRTDDRVIAGVASGIAAYLGIEPWVVRIGFIVLTPFGGFGVLAYVIAWLLIPAAGSHESLALAVMRRPSGLRTYIGVALVLLAVAILASAFSQPSVIWAIALIAFGVFLFRQDPEPPDRRPPAGGEPVPAGAVATAPPATASAATTTTTEPLGWASSVGQGATALPAPPPPVWGPPPPPPDQAAAWGAPAPRAPRRRPFLGPLTFAVALIVTGLAIALDNLDAIDLTIGQVLAVFLTVLGGGLLVGAWWGRAWGLIPIGLLALPLVALTALAGPVPVEGGVAGRLFQPQTPAEVRSSYRLAGGELILDLSKVRFGPGQPPIQVSVAGGRLLVVVPDEVAAEIRGRVGVGNLDLLGHVDTGAQVDSTVTEPAVKAPAKGAAATVKLDLMAGYGVIEVRRASDPRRFQDAGPFDDTFSKPIVPPSKPILPPEAP